MKKLILLCLVACVSSVSMAQSKYGFTVITPGADQTFQATAMSPSGQYIAAWCGSGVGSGLYDASTKEYYYLEGASEMSAVTNDGMMVGYGYIGDDVIVGYNPITGKTVVDNTTNLYPWAKACTPDGSILAGEYYDSGYVDYACYWTPDGACYTLQQPTQDEIGFDDGCSGTMAVGISEDGRTIAGVAYDWFYDGGALLWRLNDSGEYVLDPICKDLVETGYGDKPYYQYQPTGISPNGKYVAMYMQDNGSYTTYMGRYDIETGELETAKYTSSCTPSRIANDGTIIGWTGDMDSQSRNALIWEPGGGIELMADKYPEVTEFSEWDEQQDWNFPVGISPDGRYIAGGGYYYFEDDGEDYARRAGWLFDRQVYWTATGISAVRSGENSSTNSVERYSIDGKRLSAPEKGVNILKTSDGTSKKLLVK